MTGQPGKGFGKSGEGHYMAIGPKGEISGCGADTVKLDLHKFVKKS